MPNAFWNTSADYMVGVTIETSNDNITWNVLETVNGNVHGDWNFYRPSRLTSNFRFIRFKHNISSNCQFSSIKFYGIIYYNKDNPLY
jgi:hypothetical protein